MSAQHEEPPKLTKQQLECKAMEIASQLIEEEEDIYEIKPTLPVN